jgi:uncharacterized protein (DUF2147 family)
MKTSTLVILFLVMFLSPVFSQPDNIVGYWLTAEEDSQIQIFKGTDGRYYGKVVWIKEVKDRDKKDDKNPDLKLRERKLMGLQLLCGFIYNAKKKEWAHGTIYDPNNGKSYDCYMWFEVNMNNLQIKGFVLGIRFLGRETIWKKEKELRMK